MEINLKKEEGKPNKEVSYFSNISFELSSYDPWKNRGGDTKSPLEIKKNQFENQDEEFDSHQQQENNKTGKYHERYSGKGVRNKMNKINF
jgi:hypothetical protein